MTAPFQSVSSLAPRHGVLTLDGFGIKVHVDRGHLSYEDGVGENRRAGRLPRVGHGLRRLVVIGSDGFVSLAALRWLAAQDAAFVMLDRDGSVLATTGPVRPSDARLRRAQALAFHSGVATHITRELITRKLAGQEQVARDKLRDSTVADMIARFRSDLANATTNEAIRLLEAQAGVAYWGGWRNLQIKFPQHDIPRIPDHWRVFGARISPLSGSPRLAVNPANGILNYLYAVLESEARLAVAALGLDPGIGVLHADAPARDSLAFDVLEPVRPQVDAYLLDWLIREPLMRQWFFEQRDGNCRLMSSFAAHLTETAATWRHAVAPIAEWVARTIWLTVRKPLRKFSLPTRLTQERKRKAMGAPPSPRKPSVPSPKHACLSCGKPIGSRSSRCADCSVAASTERLLKAASIGRVAANSARAQARRAFTQRRHHAEQQNWQPSNQPTWLTDEVYAQKIQPLLAQTQRAVIARTLGVSKAYAAAIISGKRRPHPRHWAKLAELVGFSPDVHAGRP